MASFGSELSLMVATTASRGFDTSGRGYYGFSMGSGLLPSLTRGSHHP